MTTYFNNCDIAVKKIIESVGKDIVIGVPLGIGKPIGFLNALYRYVREDTSMSLTILTGLTLARPTYHNLLEKKFLQPILDRVLGDYEDLLYEIDRQKQILPSHIKVIEFYLSPGKYLSNAKAQQDYINTNYSDVVTDLEFYNINMIAQLVSHKKNTEDYSISSNTDLFHESANFLMQQQNNGKKIAIVGEVNNNLPFMTGKDAVVKSSQFTDIIDTTHYRKLFSIPHPKLSINDHLIGLHTSALIKDDSCIQIGIGKLGDGLVDALILRQTKNNLYKEIMNDLDTSGYTHEFTTGLFALTEMFSDSYLHLYEAGILKKKINAESDSDGKILLAGFYLGSEEFYQKLRELSETHLFEMTSINKTNTLGWNQLLAEQQHDNGRFINTAMKVTLTGAVISDGLANWQEVSGVGGQFDFAYMGRKLPNTRFIINCHSTYKNQSNIVWNYSNITVPRHLRDIVVTEYGIADCRSKTDSEVIKALLNIADSRYQPNLLKIAKRYKKVAADYQIPKKNQSNFPDKYLKIVKKLRSHGQCKAYPFGTIFTEEEQVLQPALELLKNYKLFNLILIIPLSFLSLFSAKNYKKYLERMDLYYPRTIKEFIYKLLLLHALLKIEKK